MTLDIRFSPEIEAKLKEHARVTGKEVEDFVREAVEKALPEKNSMQPPRQSTEEWIRIWREWVDSHPVRPGVHLDDSRESIYAGRE